MQEKQTAQQLIFGVAYLVVLATNTAAHAQQTKNPESSPVDLSPVRMPRPRPCQLAWQAAEFGVLVCYELHTFNPGRYRQSQARVTPITDVNQFNPTHLDTDQWIRAVRDAGARFAILTASHESGFRLWQSEVNPYCLKAVKWGQGKRDIVREFVTSCRKYGIKTAEEAQNELLCIFVAM